MIAEKQKASISMRNCIIGTNIYEILQIVSDYYQIEPKYLQSKKRFKLVTKARHVYCYICREFTDTSTTEIGRLINRDHATILHGSNKIRLEKEIYRDIKKDIENIISYIFDIPIVVKDVDLLKLSENYSKSFI